MKNKHLTFTALLFLILLTSCSEDGKFYLVENGEVLYVDNDKSTYLRGELLWLNIKIQKNQQDKNSNSEIDIFNLTGATETFVGLSLFSSENMNGSAVELNPEAIQVEKGSMIIVENNSKILGRAIYQNGFYEMRIGIPLDSTGNFFIANSGIASGGQGLAFNSNSANEVQFNTSIRNSNEEGRFEFTVQD